VIKMKKAKYNVKVLVVSLVVVYLVAFMGSLFTNADTSWYEAIKPSITPPNWVFPVVWNILFFLIALSLYFAWTNSDKDQKSSIVRVFAVNLLLNILWSLFFFGLRLPTLAFFELILLWSSIIYMVIVLLDIEKKSAYLLLPYLIWVTFAGILNYLII